VRYTNVLHAMTFKVHNIEEVSLDHAFTASKDMSMHICGCRRLTWFRILSPHPMICLLLFYPLLLLACPPYAFLLLRFRIGAICWRSGFSRKVRVGPTHQVLARYFDFSVSTHLVCGMQASSQHDVALWRCLVSLFCLVCLVCSTSLPLPVLLQHVLLLWLRQLVHTCSTNPSQKHEAQWPAPATPLNCPLFLQMKYRL